MMREAMIEAEGLTKRYGGVEALKDASFTVRRGEVVGFLGPNGAGKTTTMKILTCFIAPSSGSAKINGHDIFDTPLLAREAIGYLPESTPLYTDMLVYEYLGFMGKMRGLSGETLGKSIRRVVEETSLGDVLGKTIDQLSKGYRQRVGLAQALIHQPPLLILDEPMSGLDPNQAQEIRDLIREIGKERTVILSTHNLAEVQMTCGRVLIIAKGRLVADDTPDQLQTRAGQGRFVVDVGPDQAQAEATFTQVEGVERVEKLGQVEGALRFAVWPKGEQDLREPLFRSAVSAQLTLLGLRRESENLEQVFRQLTLGEHAAGAAPAPAEPASDTDNVTEEEKVETDA